MSLSQTPNAIRLRAKRAGEVSPPKPKGPKPGPQASARVKAGWATRKGVRLRRVVCAAQRSWLPAYQGHHAPGHIESVIAIGPRHFDETMVKHIEALERYHGVVLIWRNDADSGFIDQFGVYMTRQEAWAVAKVAGQIRLPSRPGDYKDGGILYTEHLY